MAVIDMSTHYRKPFHTSIHLSIQQPHLSSAIATMCLICPQNWPSQPSSYLQIKHPLSSLIGTIYTSKNPLTVLNEPTSTIHFILHIYVSQPPLLHLCIYQTTSSTSQNLPTKALLPDKSTPTTHTAAAAGEKRVGRSARLLAPILGSEVERRCKGQ